MKKYLLAALLFAVPGFVAYGQQLNKAQNETQKPDPTFFDLQRAFYAHYDPAHASEPEDEDGNKDGDYEKFKRWEWYWQPRVGKTGKFPAPDVLLTEWNKYVQVHPNAVQRTRPATGSGAEDRHTHVPLSSSGAWTSLGPTTSPSNYQDIGRVNCIAFDSITATTFWIGSPDGGLWKTTDGGTTWSTNTDNLPVLGISDIAIDNQHRDTMYIATGDGDGANTGGGGDSKSVGVLKTTDGGVTWNTTGLSWTLANVRFIKRLILDPTNPSVLIAATSNGIYRTTDGGTTWANTQAGYFMDMQMNPGNHNILCATTYSYGGGAQIYQSTNNGVSWTSVYTGSAIPRIKLAVTPASVNKVDALCVDATSWGFHSIMHSTDGGATWTTALTINAGCTNDYMDDANNASGCYGQGYYDVGFACSPTNPNELYLGGVNTWKSTDNGATWTIKNYWTGGGGVATVHADKHWLTYQPSTGVFFEGNDGGIYKTADGGTTWTHLSNGLVISEIYRIGTSATTAGDVMCGLQDNGSKEDNVGTWSNRTGGDGMEALIDYTNANIQYSTYVQGLIYRTTNHWGSNITLINNNATGVNSAGLWVTPYVENPLNHNGLYVGKDQLYKAPNAGSAGTAAAVTWTSISSSLTFPTSSSQLINAIAVAPTDSNTIYIACDQYLYRTTNGGTSWTLVNTAAENITYIAINNTNVNNVWFTLSGYTAGSKVFVTTTGGASWTNMSGTLPNIPVNTIVYSNTGANGEYIGTDLGVYYYGTTASDWVPFSTNLPNVVVDELEICYANNKLYAATYGRGLWSSDLYTNIAPITGTFTVCVNSTTPLTDATTGGTWSSSSTNATVGSTGIVTGVTAGTATITYTDGAAGYVTATVTVTALPSAISPANPSVCAGSTVNLTDVTAGGTWSSTNTATGTISSGGVVTGISAGTTTISYTASTGCAVTVVTTVNAIPTAVITPAGPTTFCYPGSVVLNSSTGAGYTYQWEIGCGPIVGATTSSYTAITGCSYTILITGNGCSATSAPVAVTVNSVSASPITGSGLVCIGQTTPLSDATAGGVWSSNNIAVGTVASTGVVTGISAGTTVISYSVTNTCGTAVATTILTVSAGVAVAPITGALNVCVGANTNLTDATASGTWSSSNVAVGSVNSSGVVAGVAAGTANISYNVTGGSGCISSSVAMVTVNPVPSNVIAPVGTVTVCPGGTTTLIAPSGAGYSYQWQSSGSAIAGATNSTYVTGTAGSYNFIITSAAGCSATSAVTTIVIGTGTTVVPLLSIASSLGSVQCAPAASETFTANPTNGGSSPVYQWSVNGAAVGAGATYSYVPTNGDLVSCLMTSNASCVMPDTVSASLVMTVNPLMAPSVSITSIHHDTTCVGDTVQFAAVPVYGGTAPTFLWTQNGVNVATGPYYIYVPHNNDTLIVTMTSNYPCLITPVAVSNLFIMQVDVPTTNSLSVSVTQSAVLAGRADTFTAVATGAGSSPAFQWYINGNPVAGATAYRYITDTLRDGQIVSCLETSNFLCSEPHSVMSGGISISVLPNSVPQIESINNFTLQPNPNAGSFTIKGSLSMPSDSKVDIVITDMLGQTIYKNTSYTNNGKVNELVTLPNSISNGMYLVNITSGGGHIVFHVSIDK